MIVKLMIIIAILDGIPVTLMIGMEKADGRGDGDDGINTNEEADGIIGNGPGVTVEEQELKGGTRWTINS